jgi:lysozyme
VEGVRVSDACQATTPTCRVALDEGDVRVVYDDATGKPIVAGSHVIGNPTIGRGRLLCAPGGISGSEDDTLFANDLARARKLAATLTVFRKLDAVRQGVLVEMVFQMGLAGVAEFHQALAALDRGEWNAAAAAMLDSAWARETPARAQKLAMIIETGAAA